MKLEPVPIDKRSLRFTYGDLPNNIQVLYIHSSDYPTPLGFIWYRNVLKNYMEVLYIFVHERCRKQGIGRALINEMQRGYPAYQICTALANELSEPFLKRCGFTDSIHGWFRNP